ncbi:pentatricopeptide repeat-containing protein At1g80270, mitochondrial-like isoform X2 [Prosopis cineraria]|uniref:pentatricopeptide repeat-containing protein At1g80270, mitochondrial-like isoform X2 n=1 Tax=Prosopis cineraria TaxID=364024 RepID=UPI00240F98FA|nr:pentatricopeptide repeat-containing protein At1g80270, mitochondrial-like isoform X2 [Prosopis cineraria]
MLSLLRSARPLKKQECCLKFYGLPCVSRDSSNFCGDRAGGSYPEQLSSRFSSREEIRCCLPVFGNNSLGSHRLFSQISEKSGHENDVKDTSVELEKIISGNVNEGTDEDFEEDEAVELVSEPGFLDEDLSDSEAGLSTLEPLKEKASLKLFRTLVEIPSSLISKTLDNFFKDGGGLSQEEASKIISCLRKCRMYGRALQFSELLGTFKHFEHREHDYASRIDLIAKVQGVDAAEKYMDEVPESLRGNLLYGTLLANCVRVVNRKKAEAVFGKMRRLGLPITTYDCNQMIILYKRLDRSKIADILSLMEEENLKPSRLTYRILIAEKSELKDTIGMELLIEAMKSQGLQLDIHALTIIASHFISEGLKDKALVILNEIESGKLKDISGGRSALLSLYASLGMADDVNRVWTVCKLKPTMNECLAGIAAWGKLGKVEEAEAVFDMMLKKWKELPSKIYADLLNVYVQNNKISEGKEFVRRIGDVKGWVGPLIWDGLVRLYAGDGDVGKADSILSKVVEEKNWKRVRVRPMFSTFLYVMEQYAKLGDIHNTEKWHFRMKQCGYTGRLRPYEILTQAYINAKTPAYGLKERMKAENVYPNKLFYSKLAQIESIQREVLLFQSTSA